MIEFLFVYKVSHLVDERITYISSYLLYREVSVQWPVKPRKLEERQFRSGTR